MQLYFLILTLAFVAPHSAVNSKPVELVTAMDYPPFNSRDAMGGGLFTEIVDEAFKAVDTEFVIKFMPSKRVYRAVYEGDYIGTYGWSHTEKRDQDFFLSLPIYANESVLFTSLPDLTRWELATKRQAAGKQTTFCVPLGWRVFQALQPLIDQGAITIFRPEKLRSCFELLLTGRVHMIAVPQLTLLHMQKKIEEMVPTQKIEWPTMYKIPGPVTRKRTMHLMFTRNAAGKLVKELFDTGFRKIVARGTYRQILDRHIGAYPAAEKEVIYHHLKLAGFDLE